MWEPVGPLPASVYWRRRCAAVASTIIAVLIVAWIVSALAAPAAPTLPTRASRATVTAPEQASPSPAAPSTLPSALPLTQSSPGAEGPQFVVPSAAGPVLESIPQPSPPPTLGAPTTTSEELRPDDTARPQVSVAAPLPVPPTGPVPCGNDMLAVAAEVDRPQHRVGERPVLRLVVTNVSGQPCVRDLDAARQEIVVWSNDLSTRLWSSNDCVNGSSVDLRTLVPGQPVAFAVTWAGRTTAPGCPLERALVPAGPYQVMARVDDVISPPTPFLRNP